MFTKLFVLLFLSFAICFLLFKYQKKIIHGTELQLVSVFVGFFIILSIFFLAGIWHILYLFIFFGALVLCYLCLYYKSLKKSKLGHLICLFSLKDNKHLFFALTLLVCGVFSILMSYNSFLIAEGWYTSFAEKIGGGEQIYRNFECLFPPLYTHIIALFTKFWGYDLYVLKIVGIVLFMLLATVCYYIFYKIFNEPIIASVIAIISMFYLQAGTIVIYYDYIRFFDFFTYLGTLFLILYVRTWFNDNKQRYFNFYISLIGIFLSLSYLTRQSSGAINCAYVIILLVFFMIFFADKNDKKILFVHLLSYLLAFALPIILCFIIMSANGTLELFLQKTTTNALAAKGGMFAVLFNWMPRVIKRILSLPCLILIVSAFVVIVFNLFMKIRGKAEENFQKNETIFSILFFVFSAIGIILCYCSHSLSNQFSSLQGFVDILPDVLFVIIVVLFLYEFVYILMNKKLLKEDKKFHFTLFSVLGMTIAINYGCGTSGGLDFGQTALNLGLVLGLVLYLCKYKHAFIMRLLILIGSVSLVLVIASKKYITPYSWWGLEEKDIRENNRTFDIPLLKHIKVSDSTYSCVQGIYDAIMQNSSKDDKIFVFPHAPIFYTLTGRQTETYTLVQWFDVSSDKAVIEDISVLKNNPPKVLVHIHVPDFVVKGHEDAFRSGQKSGFSYMDDALRELERTQYELLESYVVQNYPVTVWKRIE